MTDRFFKKGDLFAEQYRIDKPDVARGNSGQLMQASHVESGDPVMIKIPALDADPDKRHLQSQDIKRETAILKRLHADGTLPGVIPLLDAGTDTRQGSEYHYLVLPLLGGATTASLKAIVQQDYADVQGILVPEMVEICLSFLLILQQVHSRGVIYNDVKPDHIFWERRYPDDVTGLRITVIDWANSYFEEDYKAKDKQSSISKMQDLLQVADLLENVFSGPDNTLTIAQPIRDVIHDIRQRAPEMIDTPEEILTDALAALEEFYNTRREKLEKQLEALQTDAETTLPDLHNRAWDWQKLRMYLDGWLNLDGIPDRQHRTLPAVRETRQKLKQLIRDMLYRRKRWLFDEARYEDVRVVNTYLREQYSLSSQELDVLELENLSAEVLIQAPSSGPPVRSAIERTVQHLQVLIDRKENFYTSANFKAILEALLVPATRNDTPEPAQWQQLATIARRYYDMKQSTLAADFRPPLDVFLVTDWDGSATPIENLHRDVFNYSEEEAEQPLSAIYTGYSGAFSAGVKEKLDAFVQTLVDNEQGLTDVVIEPDDFWHRPLLQSYLAWLHRNWSSMQHLRDFQWYSRDENTWKPVENTLDLRVWCATCQKLYNRLHRIDDLPSDETPLLNTVDALRAAVYNGRVDAALTAYKRLRRMLADDYNLSGSALKRLDSQIGEPLQQASRQGWQALRPVQPLWQPEQKKDWNVRLELLDRLEEADLSKRQDLQKARNLAERLNVDAEDSVFFPLVNAVRQAIQVQTGRLGNVDDTDEAAAETPDDFASDAASGVPPFHIDETDESDESDEAEQAAPEDTATAGESSPRTLPPLYEVSGFNEVLSLAVRKEKTESDEWAVYQPVVSMLQAIEQELKKLNTGKIGAEIGNVRQRVQKLAADDNVSDDAPLLQFINRLENEYARIARARKELTETVKDGAPRLREGRMNADDMQRIIEKLHDAFFSLEESFKQLGLSRNTLEEWQKNLKKFEDVLPEPDPSAPLSSEAASELQTLAGERGKSLNDPLLQLYSAHYEQHRNRQRRQQMYIIGGIGIGLLLLLAVLVVPSMLPDPPPPTSTPTATATITATATATITPTPTVTSTPDPRFGTALNAAPIYAEPDLNAPINGQLEAGEQLIVRQRSADGRFLRVEAPAGNGFVLLDDIQYDRSFLNDLDVYQPTPTPAPTATQPVSEPAQLSAGVDILPGISRTIISINGDRFPGDAVLEWYLNRIHVGGPDSSGSFSERLLGENRIELSEICCQYGTDAIPFDEFAVIVPVPNGYIEEATDSGTVLSADDTPFVPTGFRARGGFIGCDALPNESTYQVGGIRNYDIDCEGRQDAEQTRYFGTYMLFSTPGGYRNLWLTAVVLPGTDNAEIRLYQTSGATAEDALRNDPLENGERLAIYTTADSPLTAPLQLGFLQQGEGVQVLIGNQAYRLPEPVQSLRFAEYTQFGLFSYRETATYFDRVLLERNDE